MLKEKLKNKNVLFIPIYSMRDYQTGKYNLSSDGNMARIVSKVNELECNKITILYPSNSINLDLATKPLSNKRNINWESCIAYGKNAKQTRDDYESFIDWLKNIEDFDYIVCEPNYLTFELCKKYKEKIIYWCVASITSEMCPWFVEDYIEVDKKIAQLIPTAVCTKTQVEALKGLSFIESFYDASAFDYKTIFFPFRISDKSYMFDEFRMIIDNIYKSGLTNFKVLYTDPNESLKENLNDEVFVKVPSDKHVYLSILKSKPIIPYFEDSNNILHISIFEFMYYNCNVIMFKNDNIHHKSFIEINSFENFEEVLRRLLNE